MYAGLSRESDPKFKFKTSDYLESLGWTREETDSNFFLDPEERWKIHVHEEGVTVLGKILGDTKGSYIYVATFSEISLALRKTQPNIA